MVAKSIARYVNQHACIAYHSSFIIDLSRRLTIEAFSEKFRNDKLKVHQNHNLFIFRTCDVCPYAK